jgi:DNA-binding MarR family transcriptional regulator
MVEKRAKKLAELAPRIMGAFHNITRIHPEKEHITMRQYQALIILHANDTLSLSEFCQKLSLAASTGTELANRMIEMGYFYKSSNPADRRQFFLRVTPKGLRLLEERQKAMIQMFIQLMEPFSEKDQELFVQSFEQILFILTKYPKKVYAPEEA